VCCNVCYRVCCSDVKCASTRTTSHVLQCVLQCAFAQVVMSHTCQTEQKFICMSWHTCKIVTSNVRMRHGTHMNESCHTRGPVMSHTTHLEAQEREIRRFGNTLQHTATHATHTATLYNTLQHTVTQCNTLRYTITHNNTLQQTATRCNTHCNTLQHTTTHCNTRLKGEGREHHRIGNTLQHTAAHCSTLQHTAAHCSTLQHTAAHCSTLQHIATYCNILQHTAAHYITHKHLKAEERKHHFIGVRKLCRPLFPRHHQHCYHITCKCVAVCCSVLQCVVVCCSVYQCDAACCSSCCSVLQCVLQTLFSPAIINIAIILPACSVLQCVAVCCRVLQCVAVCCSVMQCVAECCSVMMHVIVRVVLCCSVCFRPPIPPPSSTFQYHITSM